jgi:hypothetical protein
MNVLFVGGPKDGTWEWLQAPLYPRYEMVMMEGSLHSGGGVRTVHYLLEHLASGIERHPVYLWHEIPGYELVPAPLKGYRQP